jgi:hypothetical protein
MFKTWQIFVFSLIPLALVFAGVFIGSIHGSDSELEVFPTPAPAATPRSLAVPDSRSVVLSFTASDLRTQGTSLTAQGTVPASKATDLLAPVSPSVLSQVRTLVARAS